MLNKPPSRNLNDIISFEQIIEAVNCWVFLCNPYIMIFAYLSKVRLQNDSSHCPSTTNKTPLVEFLCGL